MNPWDRFLCDVMAILGLFGALMLAYALMAGIDAGIVPSCVSVGGAVGVNLLLRRRPTPTDGHPVDTVRGRQ